VAVSETTEGRKTVFMHLSGLDACKPTYLAHITMKKLLVFVASLGVFALAAIPAGAKVPGTNGQIAFTRHDQATDEPHTFIANPDGTDEHELPLPLSGGDPVWSPGGSKLSVNVFRPEGAPRPATVNPDGSGFTVLDVPELPRDTDMGCRAWSPDSSRLLCGVIDFTGHNELDGIYTIHSSDGGGLTRLTTNPYPPAENFGGGDIPGDYSPDGTQFVFTRAKPGSGSGLDQTGALFVENTDGTGLHQITPYGLANSHDEGTARWSPDGNEILFAALFGRFSAASLFVVHSDGTGLKAIHLSTPGSASFPLNPDWSPDGTRIIFSLLLSPGQEDIYTARRDGTDVRRVTDTPESEDRANWGTHPLAP